VSIVHFDLSVSPLADSAAIGHADPRNDPRLRFEAEVLSHLDAMYSFALKLTRSRHNAEDLVSDAVLRAFERWHQYQLGTNIRGWLFTIQYRVFAAGKRRSEVVTVSTSDETHRGRTYDPPGDMNPEARFYSTFLDAEIVAAIDRLPDHYRETVVLSDIHDVRFAEIAHILGVPEGTVKSRLFRGRRLLQESLVRYASEMGYIKRVAVPEAA
jgi:RNA polymerase sigma-70 factor, ECF subfamily